jgi:hypothetical protein
MTRSINKTLSRSLKKISNKELLNLGASYRILNRTNSTNSFQRDYNTILIELRRRKLTK